MLDDGRRPEFRDFAEEAGCGYIIRANNHTRRPATSTTRLQITNGELIAIFDCDHVPTRAFLQLTIGWFLKRPQARACCRRRIISIRPIRSSGISARTAACPNEGQLFYGLIQAGNDFWNATFFCGSCAVLRRAALEEIGGIATETVTEDAHTRCGCTVAAGTRPTCAGRWPPVWRPRRLSIHIGQRMRWARGMTQIFRIDNPLLGRGL